MTDQARHSLWRRLVRSPRIAFGTALLAALALVCIGAPILTPYDPTQQQIGQALAVSSPSHPLGTDGLGRDVLARLLYGGRYSMVLGLLAVLIGVGVGLPTGSSSGYVGGWYDLIMQRFTDILLAFPGILLALALVAGLGIGLRNVVIAVGISSIPGFVRLARASALSARELEYVEAAKALGLSSWAIVLRHIIPECLPSTVVQATLQIGTAILVAAGLGFLGLGVQPPTPEWGSMLGDARNYIFRSPQLSTYPGMAIFLVVMGFNVLGDGLRDVLDPQL